MKIGHNKEAKALRIYCVKHWKESICSKFSCSTSAICAIVIRPNFSSNRRCCILSSEMDSI